MTSFPRALQRTSRPGGRSCASEASSLDMVRPDKYTYIIYIYSFMIHLSGGKKYPTRAELH